MFWQPTILDCKAPKPIAMLSLPVVLATNVLQPIAMLSIPVEEAKPLPTWNEQ